METLTCGRRSLDPRQGRRDAQRRAPTSEGQHSLGCRYLSDSQFFKIVACWKKQKCPRKRETSLLMVVYNTEEVKRSDIPWAVEGQPSASALEVQP
jgi:hypothetical protein